MNRVILSPEYFPNPTIGRPIANADIYVGIVDLDPTVLANQKQISVQQESGVIVQVAQPVNTGAGGVPLYQGSPVTILVDGDYSLKVLDSLGAQIYYVPSNSFVDGFVTSVDGYTELRAITATVNNEQYSLAYRSTLGDGGGGKFIWDSSDLSLVVAADTLSGIYIAPDSDATGVSGAWVRQYTGAVDVRWFGAVEGGAISATASVNAAIGTLLPVHIPAGTWLGNYEIPNNAILNDTANPDGTEKGGMLTGTTQTILLQEDATLPVIRKTVANGRLYNWTLGPFVFKSDPLGSAVEALNMQGMTMCTVNQPRGITNGGNAFSSLIMMSSAPPTPGGNSGQCHANTINDPTIESSEGYTKMISFENGGLGVLFNANSNTINTPKCFNNSSMTHAIDCADSYGIEINNPVIELCVNATGIKMGDGTIVNAGSIETMLSCFDYTAATAVRSTVIGTTITNNGTNLVQFGATSGGNTWIGVNDKTGHTWVGADDLGNEKNTATNVTPGAFPVGLDIVRVTGATGTIATTSKTTLEPFTSLNGNVSHRTEIVLTPTSTAVIRMGMEDMPTVTGFTWVRTSQDFTAYGLVSGIPIPTAFITENNFIFEAVNTVDVVVIGRVAFKLVPTELLVT